MADERLRSEMKDEIGLGLLDGTEDGVLLAPAPYSAPAAYYFPLITRMTGVDVFMGAASIPYGPHTVGGAIDFHDRPIPTESEGGVDLGLGNTWFGRFHAHYGTSNEWGGFIVEAVHIRTDGFRQLDFSGRDGSTGFDRTDVNARGELHGDLTPDIYHRLELAVGLGLEGSNETYLGLADRDLRANPLRRYGASSLDRMDWWRTRVMLRYELLSDVADLLVTAYRHDFDRTWQRVDGFRDGTSIADVLQNPTRGRNAVYYGIVSGMDEATTPGQAVLIVRNHRTFISQGIQARARFRIDTGAVQQVVEVGARLHYDEVVRHHTGLGFDIQNSMLVNDGQPEALLTNNRAQSVALSSYVAWQFRFLGFAVTPGIRLETVWGEFVDRTSGLEETTVQVQPLPGIGLTYELIHDLSLFGGVHQGYSPSPRVSPKGPARSSRSTTRSVRGTAAPMRRATPSSPSSHRTTATSPESARARAAVPKRCSTAASTATKRPSSASRPTSRTRSPSTRRRFRCT